MAQPFIFQPKDIVLVACVAGKAVDPAPAKDLYRSDWFAKARAFAEASGKPWMILSALHGAIDPDKVIAPYDASMRDKSKFERRAWASIVSDQVQPISYGCDRVILIAGRDYRDPLAADDIFKWRNPRQLAPMEGLGIGHQKQWLANMGAMPAAPAQLDLFERKAA